VITVPSVFRPMPWFAPEATWTSEPAAFVMYCCPKRVQPSVTTVPSDLSATECSAPASMATTSERFAGILVVP
jgi:hypothetical protein